MPPTKRVRVLFFEIEKPVSLRQHRYWRLLCRFVEKQTGNDATDFHKDMKKKFAVEIITINNRTYEHIPSMGSMSMPQAAEFITKGIQFIEETFGFECPRPDDVPPEWIIQNGGQVSDFY